MELDFTAIRGSSEKPLESSLADFAEPCSIEVPVGTNSPQNAPQRAPEGTETAGRLLAQYRQEKTEKERALDVYREYQKNIRESEELRAAILKGAKAGEQPVDLLLKAVKCISLMTKDTVFYNQIEGYIKQCGAGLPEHRIL